jgi:hypothetical protein
LILSEKDKHELNGKSRNKAKWNANYDTQPATLLFKILMKLDYTFRRWYIQKIEVGMLVCLE